jgi:protein-tyrosine phosphatase
MKPWPGERATNGGADEIPLPEGPGRLWLCGKHFVGPNPEEALRRLGADRVICLCERPEIAHRYPEYMEWLEDNAGDRAEWFPIPDLHAPGSAEVLPLLDRMREMIAAGDGLLLHCGAGIGRAGTLAAALLIRMGIAPGDARRAVAAARPMAGPEGGTQEALLTALGEGTA